MRSPTILLALALVASALARPAAAQEPGGRVVGRVISTQTGEGLGGVQLSVTETAVRATTDASGRFVLNGVPAGSRSITAQQVGYATKTVTGVRVAAGEVTRLNISIAPSAVALEGLVVTAQRERGTTTQLLSERMRAPVVQDAIGQEQIGRTPDSNAAEAVRRLPGASVVDGQFVYIRGLGERYGATTLNGAPMASPLPDKKAVPLDVIPANLLESVVVVKTYSPDQPGDYAGGLVQIRTRSVPTTRSLRLFSSVGYNTAASLQPAFGTQGGDFDFLGFDDGARDLPSGVFGAGGVEMPADPAARQVVAQGLTRRFGVEGGDQPLNQSYGIAYGDEINLAGRPVGVVGTVSLSNSYQVPQGNLERVFKLDAGGAPADFLNFDVDAGEHETSLGSLLGVSFEVAPAQRITATGTYNRLVEDQSRKFTGPYLNTADYVEAYQTRYVANSIANVQLEGEHLVGLLGGVSAKWRASYGRAERDEPGTRVAAYGGVSPTEPVYFLSTSSSGLIFAQDLSENLFASAADFGVPFRFRDLPATLSFGASADRRDRGVFTRRIFLSPNGIPADVSTLPPGELFVPSRIGPNVGQFAPRDRTFPQDNYNADQTVLAAYGMVDAEILPRLRAVGGVRVESAVQNVTVRNQQSPGTELNNTDLLPALNLTYALNPFLNLRAAISRTVARPQFRERAPFLYEDFFGAVPTRGNPFVQRASILNYDLRGEWLGDSGMLFSVGGFLKRFTDPIEPVFFNLGNNLGQSFANAESGEVYGAELELRVPFEPMSDALRGLSFDGNLTLARSAVSGDSVLLLDAGGFSQRFPANREADRALYEQSPYVVNLGLSYFLDRTGTSATVLYNRFGRRLSARGINQLPDIYEEGRGSLDVVFQQPLRSGLALKLAAERLVGDDIKFTQTFPNGETVVTRGYDPGRTVSVSLSWEPWENR